MGFKLAWISQPLWVANESEVLNRTRLWFMIFWKHFDSLFITFIICFFLAISALMLLIKAYRGQTRASSTMLIFGSLGILCIFLVFYIGSARTESFRSEPLFQARSATLSANPGTAARVSPCRILSAKYLFKDEPTLANQFMLPIKVEFELVPLTGSQESQKVIEILPRNFRGYLIDQKFPIDGWVWIGSATGLVTLLGIDETQIKF